MKPASDISDFSLQTVLAVAPAEDQPEAPVRRRMRAMWGT
jgi:hypothetical protein